MVCKSGKKRAIAYSLCILLLVGIIVIILFFGSWYPIRYKDLIARYSAAYNLSPELVGSVINTESRFNPNAVSPAGALGLMQLMPTTASEIASKLHEEYTRDRMFDAATNIRYGCYYLRYLYGLYGDTVCVLAAYNAGLGVVNGWLKNADYSTDGKHLKYIPYKETRNYVSSIISNRSAYKIYW